MEYKTTGLTHLINSTKYSLQGLRSAFKNETAFRHELLLGIMVVPLAFLLASDKIELILMLAAYFIVLIAELLNSAVECAIDRIGMEHHELSGRAKDQGSAAVFVALVNFAITWGVILFF
ncbi:MAG: diacylglycerol kinase [[Actinobacillus] rossii]|uniref:Diacylglycerol kinase n=1 Tax=[Actinobacillus] rossii TaxID=123820 RepID=A0A380TMG6_9PAST|nr:diacylglycerol kinase [[Actinobacillus] rossii]MDD7425840.1 diacylglycerol kinase [[Actinobacillus] rossii]MDY3124770.1 diacylglycerol kinase [[Actinobacillus] rossii]MDY4506046.1 diacylglycerol kinase [[Actinobacillus] rossii]SUT88411.1 diacylglycerol kinase [[Actinobacillus] rossii]